MHKRVDPLSKAMIQLDRRTATDQMIKLMLPLYVLYAKGSSGQVRCERFAEESIKLDDAYRSSYVVIEDLMQV